MSFPPSSSPTIKPHFHTPHSPHHLHRSLTMAAFKPSLLLAFFLLFSTSFARQQQHQQQQWWQQNQCQLRNIEALEPYDVIQAEAGLTEFWDANNQQFQCAGVDFVRHRIQPGGLLLPSYVNTPILSFVERGHAVHGVILPGCPETYQYSPEQTSSESRQDISDRHQRVESLNQGDLVAVPTGAAHWIHNDGNEELVVVVFFDTQNQDNQLDQYRRRFFLAGNPQAQSQQQQQPRGQRGQQQHHQSRGQREDQPHRNADNIFKGFDIRYLAEVFNVDEQTAQKLQGQNDQRGHIVNAGQNLQLVRPQQQQGGRSDRRGGWSSNGIEETICSLKLSINIDNPSHADFVNPQAGQIANLNTFKFPILGLIKLSAERGQLHQNAIQSPHWTLNAHNLLYVTHGSMRIQIVNNEGNSVFDNELQQGQVVVIPQNFGVIKRAGDQGCRWVSFKTNDNAMISNLAGRVSAMTSMPVDVVANAYQIPREDAQRLKFSQRETVLLSPSYSRGQQKASI